jgi:hypothetical protein
MRTIKNILLATLPTLIILLIVFEVFFRTIIRADEPPRTIFDEGEKMLCFSNKKDKGLCTEGRFAEIKANWRINNMHWNYPVDYFPEKKKKLIAVIGDSYIEALQVDVDKKYPFLLRDMIKDKYEVYAFGISGAPLSQYLNISRYVNRHFNPDILIFNIVHNDFDESIQQLNPGRNYFLKVSIDNDGLISETIPVTNHSLPQYKPWKMLLYKSALFRYLFLNLHIKDKEFRVVNKKYEANVNIHDLNAHKELIIRATEYLVKTIRDENKEKRIIFIHDAARDKIYNNTLNESKLLWINEMLDRLCKNNRIEYINLAPVMQKEYMANHKRFEFGIDMHWNEYGHRFVADYLYEYLNRNNN